MNDTVGNNAMHSDMIWLLQDMRSVKCINEIPFVVNESYVSDIRILANNTSAIRNTLIFTLDTTEALYSPSSNWQRPAPSLSIGVPFSNLHTSLLFSIIVLFSFPPLYIYQKCGVEVRNITSIIDVYETAAAKLVANVINFWYRPKEPTYCSRAPCTSICCIIRNIPHV